MDVQPKDNSWSSIVSQGQQQGTKIAQSQQRRDPASTISSMTDRVQERIQHVAGSAQETLREAPAALEQRIKAMVPAEQEPKVEEGFKILRRYLNLPFAWKMESEICKAQNVLKNLKDFPAYMDGKLVSNMIKNAEAVVFITSARAGLFVSGQIGSGIVLSKLGDGSWSPPLAIFYLGSGVGLQGGWDVTDYVLPLSKASLQSFVGNNQLVLGGDFGFTLGLGRHATGDLHMGSKKASVALGYAFSKGLYAGAAAQAGIIKTRGDINKKFYAREVDPQDILSGKVVKPRAAKGLYDALNALP